MYEVESSNGSRFALKVLSKESARSSDKVKRFLREAMFLSSEKASGIAKAIDTGFIGSGDTKRPFYVMRLYDRSLRAMMQELSYGAGELLPLLLSLFSDLHRFYAKGNVHRDIKPENILYDKETGKLLLADFGTAHLIGEFPGATVQTKPSDRLANFNYAAPEQCDKSGRVGQWTDIYAFGLIMNELFTGTVPRGTSYKTIGSVAKEYAFLDKVVARMISQSPDDRYKTLSDVLIDIEALTRQRELEEQLIIAEQWTPQLDDESRVVVDRILVDGSLKFVLDSAPSYEWTSVFKSYPESTFSTDGYHFETRRFQIDGDVVTVPRAGEYEERARQAVLDFDKVVAWTNQNVRAKRENDAKLAHDEEVRQRQAAIGKAEKDAEAQRAFSGLLAELYGNQ